MIRYWGVIIEAIEIAGWESEGCSPRLQTQQICPKHAARWSKLALIQLVLTNMARYTDCPLFWVAISRSVGIGRGFCANHSSAPCR